MSDDLQVPSGFEMKDLVAWGNTGLIFLDKSSCTVVKIPHGPHNSEDMAIERRIYERLNKDGGHDGILRYYGTYESGIRLEYACNHSVWSFLNKRGEKIDMTQRLRWAGQVASALAYAHSKRVIHGDLTWGNILLDADLRARLSDFGGSSLDGSPLIVAVAESHMYPGPGPITSIQGDIFALGSTIYEFMTGVSPFDDLEDEEIELRYSKGVFPDTTGLGLIGDVVKQCWTQKYCDCQDIIEDIRGRSSYLQG